VTTPGPVPSNLQDQQELALLAAGFPAFRLWRETTWEGNRSIAQGRNLAVRPHTLAGV
jgi:hypothetical protein